MGIGLVCVPVKGKFKVIEFEVKLSTRDSGFQPERLEYIFIPEKIELIGDGEHPLMTYPLISV